MADNIKHYEQEDAALAADALEQSGPAYGVTMIDGRPATSVRFERNEKNGDAAYTVSFHMANKQVARYKDLDAESLSEAVGKKNAKAIMENEADRGSLKGEELQYDNGLSPEEKARRLALAQTQAADAADHEPDSPDEVNKIEWVPEHEQVNVSEPLERVNIAEALVIAARLRQRDREALEATQTDLGHQAEGKRIKVENLSEKAVEQDNGNRLAERTDQTTDYQSQIDTEREKNRQIQLMESLHHQFRVSGPRFHFKDQPSRIAFKDKGSKMVSASNDERVAKAMATMADAKGWKTITVAGHPDFQREVWMEASLRGIEVRGFRPQQQDLEALEARRDHQMRNSVEHNPERDRQKAYSAPESVRTAAAQEQNTKPLSKAPSPITPEQEQTKPDLADAPTLRSHSGLLLNHGEANYNHDPEESKSYFVTLADKDGKEETVWGVDLKRAMAESRAKPGEGIQLDFKGKQPVTVTANIRDDQGKVIGKEPIETERNSWVVKSNRAKVVEAIAEKVIDSKFKDPDQRAAAREAVSKRLQSLDKQGAVPPVPIYDKTAARRGQEQEQARPQVERHAERTR
ncbi:LPD7 domain-containing protein [Pseudomonas sp. LPH60]|uniref:LPD7 domain-containing protein n=2 Tax=Gammaproteobacteria TaxID=1236 RepID=UPI00273B6061|nr:LPD7 domain-containing protein [Pseudomonas sp. LPH60]MDP4573440.1 LPD7 domain-containing protein [Pseudomonas sp. LPH60]